MKKSIPIGCPNCHTRNYLDLETALISPYPVRFRTEKPVVGFVSQKIQKCSKCQIVLAENKELFKVEGDILVKYRIRDVNGVTYKEAKFKAQYEKNPSDQFTFTEPSLQSART